MKNQVMNKLRFIFYINGSSGKRVPGSVKMV